MFLSSATALAQATRQVFFTAAEGSGLVGIAVSYDDTVYGALGSGGARNLGTLVRRTPDGRVSVLHHFDGAEGSQPMAAPVFGPNGELYGTTASGGDHGYGTAYRIAASGELSVLHHFTVDDGGAVRVPLTLTSDGRVVGVTSGVYTVDCFPFYDCHLAVQHTGKIFQLPADGAFTALYDGIINPAGAVIEASDGNLYGARATVSGMSIDGNGIFSQGSIYRLRPDGAISFEGSSVPGFDPRGDLIESIDGYLIGMSMSGVFRMTLGPDDTQPQISSVAAADMAPGGLALGSDGKLYGGHNGFLRLALDGQVTQLRSFDAQIKPPTAAMRADSCATTFFVPSGDDLNQVRTNGAATTLHRFGYQNGRQLEPDSLLVTRAGEVYGTTSLGGAYENGTLFKVRSGGALSAVYHFPRDEMQFPSKLRTPLVEAADGALYGVTYETAPKLVRFDPPLTEGASTVLTTLHVFDAPKGWPTPQPDSLVIGVDGLLYGTIEAPPNEYNQIRRLVYRFDPHSGQLQTFGTYDDVGPLLAASTGVYGTSGIAQNNGCSSYSYQLFRLTPAGERQVLHAFPTTPDGYIPISSLAEGPDHAIYGVANGRSDTVARVVYRWTAASALENFAEDAPKSDPYEHGFSRHVAVGTAGEVYITRRYGFDANDPSAQTKFILPNKTSLTLQLPLYLGVVSDPDRGIYRVAPLERDGYAGVALIPIHLP